MQCKGGDKTVKSKIICGGCGKYYENISELKGVNKKNCPLCGYSLFMIVGENYKEAEIDFLQRLNSRQKQIIEYIKTCLENKSFTPTAEDIKNKLNFKSISTVYYHLNALKKKGYISFKQGNLHTLKLLPKVISESDLLCISDKQCELLKIIDDYLAQNNKSPTTQELQEIMGVQSIATLVYHLDKLQEFGLIDKVRYKHRSIVITGKGRNILNILNKKEGSG